MNALEKIWLSKTAFWDVDIEKLDAEKDAFVIISKVANYWLWNDYTNIFKYYGKDIIKKNILETGYLQNNVLSFFSNYFNIDNKKFACYKRKQSNPQLWNY